VDGGAGGVVEEGAVLSIDEIRQRRLREMRVSLVADAEGTSHAAPLVDYFSVAHHGSSKAPYHIDLAPGTQIFLEGDARQVLGSDFLSSLRGLKITRLWVSDIDVIDKANVTRHVGSAATLDPTPTDSIPAPPDVTLLFLFLSKEKRDSFFGDLQERYEIILKVNGSRSAALWFWRQVIHSFFSLAFDTLKRISGLEKLYRRIGS
jgi:hypothetical protein